MQQVSNNLLADATTVGKQLLSAADATAAKAALNLAAVATSGSYNDLADKPTGGGTPPQINLYTLTTHPSGTATWTKPTGAKSVNVQMFGGGGGGGSGRKDASSNVVHCGGGGGGGGSYLNVTLPADALDSTVAITIGAGGNGGNGQTATANGVDGTNGFNSTFGTLVATGGG